MLDYNETTFTHRDVPFALEAAPVQPLLKPARAAHLHSIAMTGRATHAALQVGIVCGARLHKIMPRLKRAECVHEVDTRE